MILPLNPAYRTELFGPVACVYKVHSEEEAIALANDVPYGLGGAVFAGDTDHAAEVAARLKPGWSVPIRVKATMLSCHLAGSRTPAMVVNWEI